jgi:ABC-type glycerol-3-phosphate transport system substrate-binding protein
MPRLADGEYYSRWYQKSLAVFQTNEARENATLEFLSWFYSPEIQARWSVEAGYLPITESAQETEIWQSHLEDFPQYQVFVEQSENLGILEKGVPHGDIGTMLDAVRFDEATPEEAVATYIETAQQQLDQFWARRSN